MKNMVKKLLINQSGQGLVEYGLIISLVVLAAIGAVHAFGIEVSDLYDYISNETSEIL